MSDKAWSNPCRISISGKYWNQPAQFISSMFCAARKQDMTYSLSCFLAIIRDSRVRRLLSLKRDRDKTTTASTINQRTCTMKHSSAATKVRPKKKKARLDRRAFRAAFTCNAICSGKFWSFLSLARKLSKASSAEGFSPHLEFIYASKIILHSWHCWTI